MPVTLIADSGATKAEWCLINNGKKKGLFTQGINPYFLSSEQIRELIQSELKSNLKKTEPEQIFFYGTGCANPKNAKNIKDALKAFSGVAQANFNYRDVQARIKALRSPKQ